MTAYGAAGHHSAHAHGLGGGEPLTPPPGAGSAHQHQATMVPDERSKEGEDARNARRSRARNDCAPRSSPAPARAPVRAPIRAARASDGVADRALTA